MGRMESDVDVSGTPRWGMSVPCIAFPTASTGIYRHPFFWILLISGHKTMPESPDTFYVANVHGTWTLRKKHVWSISAWISTFINFTDQNCQAAGSHAP